MKDMDRESLSQSIDSEKEESDHKEVYNTFKYRGRTLTRWKRLVKMNSTVLLIFSWIWFLYLLAFSTTKHWHNYLVWVIWLASAVFGLSTGFSFNNPTSVKIYTNSVITGIGSLIVCLYTLIMLATMVLISIDDRYIEQYNQKS